MSDKFFDKDNNFILWKDKGDLTEASKYVGDNRSSIGVGESLVTKIAKGKVDIGRTYGMVNKGSVTVNWGKCGGTEDVIVTYNEGDDLWIPKAFLWEPYLNKENDASIDEYVSGKTSVGYVGWVHISKTLSNSCIFVYKLPQKLGEYLYSKAESFTSTKPYGGGSMSGRYYKGIAIYSDTAISEISEGSDIATAWGVGIRTKEDIAQSGYNSTGDPSIFTKDSYGWDSELLNHLESGVYYLVSQSVNIKATGGTYTLGTALMNYETSIDDTGSDHIWFRTVGDLDAYPDKNHVASKYKCTQSLCSEYGIIEKALTVNWGKCGGSSDVIVTYNENEPLWIPKVFFTASSNYRGMQYGSANTNYLRVYTLPRSIGAYLYEVAESNTTDVDDYTDGDTTHSSNSLYHNYKGIAIYSDNPSNWSADSPYDSSNWGVGIRKKSDIGTDGHVNGEPHKCYNASALESSSYLTTDDYYMVLQDYSDGASTIISNCSNTSVDDGTSSSDHIYLRRYRDMTAVPSATNKGEKYTVPSELCNKDLTTYTETKDSITVNWGKCGGNEDVIVEYKVGDPLWIPSAFLKQAFNYTSKWQAIGEGSANYYVGEEIGYRGGRMTGSSTGLAVYNIPQELGKYLYENAESLLDKGYYGQTAQNWTRAYKGLAIYPDHIGTDSSSDWEENTHCWGIGIRTKSDIDVQGYYADGSFSTTFSDMKSGDFYNKMEEGVYYLVAQIKVYTSSSTMNRSTSKEYLQGQLSLFNIDDTGTDHIYLRHFADMTSVPSADNKGEKYPVTLDLVTSHPTLPTPNEDQVVIDWGGGIKTYYKYGEPMYVPRAFLNEGFTTFGAQNMSEGWSVTGATFAPVKDNIGNHVGYQTWFGNNDKNGVTERQTTSTWWISVYRLPDEIGEYLYNCAENNLGVHNDYSSTVLSAIGSNHRRNYKGIAIYPNNPSAWTYSEGWGVGIRKKSDLNIVGYTDSMTATTKMDALTDFACFSTFSNYQALDSNAYYLVCQMSGSGAKDVYTGHKDSFPKDEPIWMRSFNTMTSEPSATNMGKKMVFHPEYYALPLGGKIFYIDPSDNGATYSFYDENKNEITGWSTVADLANAKYYFVDGTPSKDKFYVYYPTKFDDFRWGYYATTIGVTGIAIGTGKTNTATVMARTDIPTSSIWSKLSEIRTSSGIDDWFVPSEGEIDKFREVDLESWARKSGGSSLWSSSEDSLVNAWYWYNYDQFWSNTNKNSNKSVFFMRAF